MSTRPYNFIPNLSKISFKVIKNLFFEKYSIYEYYQFFRKNTKNDFLSYSVPTFILADTNREKTLQKLFGPKHVLI